MGLSEEEVLERLETTLMSQGIYVERTHREDETLHVEYETASGGMPSEELGAVARELVDAHDDGWTPRDVHLWVFDLQGLLRGEWRVDEGWFRALDRGDISQTDFSTLVLSTRTPADMTHSN